MRIRLPLVLVAVVAVCGCLENRKVSLAQIRSPEPARINSLIWTEGYFHSSAEEDLLTKEADRFSDMIELSFTPMMAGLSNEGRFEWRRALGKRLDGKWVNVHAKIRVGPFGMLNRSTVYLDVESIREANQPPEPTPPDVRPASEHH